LKALGLIVDDEETEIVDGNDKFEADEEDDDWDGSTAQPNKIFFL
jgi:hypothetical protein